MTKPSRSAAPAWTPPYILPRADPPIDPHSTEAEDRAYHRIQGIPFRKRRTVRYGLTRHPLSPWKHLPIIAAAIRNLRGQTVIPCLEAEFRQAQNPEDTP